MGLFRKKERKKDTGYIIVNLGYLRAAVGAIFLHLNAECKRIVNKLNLKIINILVLFREKGSFATRGSCETFVPCDERDMLNQKMLT